MGEAGSLYELSVVYSVFVPEAFLFPAFSQLLESKIKLLISTWPRQEELKLPGQQ